MSGPLERADSLEGDPGSGGGWRLAGDGAVLRGQGAAARCADLLPHGRLLRRKLFFEDARSRRPPRSGSPRPITRHPPGRADPDGRRAGARCGTYPGQADPRRFPGSPFASRWRTRPRPGRRGGKAIVRRDIVRVVTPEHAHRGRPPGSARSQPARPPSPCGPARRRWRPWSFPPARWSASRSAAKRWHPTLAALAPSEILVPDRLFADAGVNAALKAAGDARAADGAGAGRAGGVEARG